MREAHGGRRGCSPEDWELTARRSSGRTREWQVGRFKREWSAPSARRVLETRKENSGLATARGGVDGDLTGQSCGGGPGENGEEGVRAAGREGRADGPEQRGAGEFGRRCSVKRGLSVFEAWGHTHRKGGRICPGDGTFLQASPAWWQGMRSEDLEFLSLWSSGCGVRGLPARRPSEPSRSSHHHFLPLPRLP